MEMMFEQQYSSLQKEAVRTSGIITKNLLARQAALIEHNPSQYVKKLVLLPLPYLVLASSTLVQASMEPFLTVSSRMGQSFIKFNPYLFMQQTLFPKQPPLQPKLWQGMSIDLSDVHSVSCWIDKAGRDEDHNLQERCSPSTTAQAQQFPQAPWLQIGADMFQRRSTEKVFLSWLLLKSQDLDFKMKVGGTYTFSMWSFLIEISPFSSRLPISSTVYLMNIGQGFMSKVRSGSALCACMARWLSLTIMARQVLTSGDSWRSILLVTSAMYAEWAVQISAMRNMASIPNLQQINKCYLCGMK